MAFGHASLPTRKYVYGCRDTVPGRTDDQGKRMKFPGHQRAVDQMFKAHVFQNKLVEIERERRRVANETVHAKYPGLAELLKVAEDLTVEVGELRAELSSRNAEARKKNADREFAKVVRERSVALAAAWRAHRAMKNLAYADPVIRESLDAADRTAQEGCDTARRSAVAEGLYWATSLIVTQRVKKSGPPPRFKRWEGEGLIAVQFQRKADKGTERVPVLDARGVQRVNPRSGKPTMRHVGGSSLKAESVYLRNTLCWLERQTALIPGVRQATKGLHKKYATVHFRVGSDADGAPEWSDLPVVIHRPLPDGAEVKWAYLSRRKIGTHYKWELHFDVAMPADSWALRDRIRDVIKGRERAESGTVAVALGWRKIDDEVRVAYWVGDDGQEGEVVVPRERVAAWLKCDDLRSIRDKLFDESRAELLEWLRQQVLPPEWKERTENLGSWRSADRMARLVIWWRQNRLPGDGAIFTRMEGELIVPARRAGGRDQDNDAPTDPAPEVNSGDRAQTRTRPYYSGGRKQDKHLLDWQSNLRAKCAAWRKCFYREFAIELSKSYKNVVVAEIDWHAVAKIPAPESGDPDVNKRFRGIAACASLRDELTDLMVEVVVPAPGIAATCHACGSNCTPPGRGQWVVCETCGGERMDRAFNAAKNLLNMGLSSVGTAEPARVT